MAELPVERELKFPRVDLDDLRSRLEALGGRLAVPRAFEDNLVFDRGGELRGAGCVLRLRRDGRGVRLTFKGAARFEDDVKVRVEHELGVGDLDAARALLEALGYELVTRYQKFRESWRLEGVEVALDATPIGDFAEFEGDAAARVAKRCGLEPSQAERSSYLELWAAHRQRQPAAGRDMVFAPGDGEDR